MGNLLSQQTEQQSSVNVDDDSVNVRKRKRDGGEDEEGGTNDTSSSSSPPPASSANDNSADGNKRPKIESTSSTTISMPLSPPILSDSLKMDGNSIVIGNDWVELLAKERNIRVHRLPASNRTRANNKSCFDRETLSFQWRVEFHFDIVSANRRNIPNSTYNVVFQRVDEKTTIEQLLDQLLKDFQNPHYSVLEQYARAWRNNYEKYFIQMLLPLADNNQDEEEGNSSNNNNAEYPFVKIRAASTLSEILSNREIEEYPTIHVSFSKNYNPEASPFAMSAQAQHIAPTRGSYRGGPRGGHRGMGSSRGAGLHRGGRGGRGGGRDGHGSSFQGRQHHSGTHYQNQQYSQQRYQRGGMHSGGNNNGKPWEENVDEFEDKNVTVEWAKRMNMSITTEGATHQDAL